jgi:S1-C subfamily serine protease
VWLVEERSDQKHRHSHSCQRRSESEGSLPLGTMERAADAGAAEDGAGEMAGMPVDSDPWGEIIRLRVAPAMVTIHVEGLANMDGGGPHVSFGSGFCVNSELGLILTNRHVVSRSPAGVIIEWGVSREETLAKVLWVDPVHDFAFVCYDPKSLKRTETCAIPLRPEGAKIGVEVRLVGSDAGE